MRARHFICALGIALTACNGPTPEPQQDTAAEFLARNAAWTATEQELVRSKLKDPDSAQFRNSNTFHGGGLPVTCGEVNSKNAFGGYTGYQRFVAAGDQVFLAEEVEDGGMPEIWAKFCRP